MLGNKYKPKQLGACSAAEIASHHDNCSITSHVVQLSAGIATCFCYYGSSGRFNVLEAYVTLGPDALGAPLLPTDKWLTWDQVPDGLRWEKRLLRPNDPVPRPKGVQPQTAPFAESMAATDQREPSVGRERGGFRAILASVGSGIMTVVGWIVGGVLGIGILALNIGILLLILWMVFGGGCEYVADTVGGQSAPSSSLSSTLSTPPKTAHYSKHSIRFAYETPTLRTVGLGDVPDSVSVSGAQFMQLGQADTSQSVAVVPTAKNPSALVMILVPSDPPPIVEQMRGMSKSQVAGFLPQIADSMEQSGSDRLAAFPEGVVINDFSVSHSMFHGVPSVLMSLSGQGQDGETFAMQSRSVFTRRNLYTVVFQDGEVGSQSDDENDALMNTFRSVAIPW